MWPASPHLPCWLLSPLSNRRQREVQDNAGFICLQARHTKVRQGQRAEAGRARRSMMAVAARAVAGGAQEPKHLHASILPPATPQVRGGKAARMGGGIGMTPGRSPAYGALASPHPNRMQQNVLASPRAGFGRRRRPRRRRARRVQRARVCAAGQAARGAQHHDQEGPLPWHARPRHLRHRHPRAAGAGGSDEDGDG